MRFTAPAAGKGTSKQNIFIGKEDEKLILAMMGAYIEVGQS